MIKLYIKDKNTISSLMAIKGFSSKKLANSIGITPNYFSSIINGNNSVGRISAFKIAKKLNVKVEDIFFTITVDKSYTKQTT